MTGRRSAIGSMIHHVPVTRLNLLDLAVNYSSVGVTASDRSRRAAPTGYRVFERTAPIGHGPDRWEFAAAAAVRWGIKTRSGFSVVNPDGSRSDQSDVVPARRHWLIARVGPLHIREPVSVVWVTRELNRVGFAYGTLQGHPVSGEESFVVSRDVTGVVSLTIRSVSRAATGRWRLAYPIVAVAQRYYRRRYFKALTGTIKKV